MLKKLVPALALTSLAFGSGLCFDPYNYTYNLKLSDSIGFEVLPITTLHHGKEIIGKGSVVSLERYITQGNKALLLFRKKDGDGFLSYYLLEEECIRGKPKPIYEIYLGDTSTKFSTFDAKRYPIRFSFYKNGIKVSALQIVQFRGSGFGCSYITTYYPYSWINKYSRIYNINQRVSVRIEGIDGPGTSKSKDISDKECNVLVNQAWKP